MSNSHYCRKVLAVDDNQINLTILENLLSRMGIGILLAETPQKGLELAFSELPDLILLDIMMPGIDGYEVLRSLKADNRTNQIPIIFLSALNQPADKIHGLELGAADYITKPFDAGELKARIEIALEMAACSQKLAMQAHTDELTNLPNRRRFCELLHREILQAKSNSTCLALAMLDLDCFKRINDTYGHLGGDVILKQFAEILRDNIYPLDIAARYGGEEFLILMPQTSLEKAYQAAEKIRRLVQQNQWKISAEPITVTTSIGLAMLPAEGHVEPQELVRRADVALYAAKRQGKNRTIVWEEMGTANVLHPRSTDEFGDLSIQIATIAQQFRTQMIGSIAGLIKEIQAELPGGGHHGENVQHYAVALAQELKLPNEFNEHLRTAALLHDLGKLNLARDILHKLDDLTENEQKILRRHPLISVQMLEPIGLSAEEKQIIRHHHERFDGSGYPDALAGHKIPFGARILAVADAYDAITINNHSYRSVQSQQDAIDEIQRCAGSQFDPDIVQAFQCLAQKHTTDWPLNHPRFVTISDYCSTAIMI